LLRESMIHLMDVTVALEQSLGRAAEKLGERCAAAASSHSSNDMANAGAILDVTIGWLLEHLTGQSEADPAVSWMAGAIRGAGGVVSVDEIGSKLSIPRSRLSRRFCHFVGVTPKRYARIIRFHRALGSISRGQAIAAVAADLGYYDQAHLYRDFSEFAGMTPGAFIAATRYPAGVSLAEP
jgi:AraC-like DNA-binding protein